MREIPPKAEESSFNALISNEKGQTMLALPD